MNRVSLLKVGFMKLQIFALITLALLFAGCTVNPQDLAAKPGVGANINPGAPAGQTGAPSAGNIVPGQTNTPSSPQNPSTGTGAPTTVTTSYTLSAAEVAKHNSANDCWMTINNVVYDLSPYTSHPGGSAYVPYCGTDGTSGYNSKGGRGGGHSSYADSLLPNFQIGTLGQTITVTSAAPNSAGTGTTQTPGTAGGAPTTQQAPAASGTISPASGTSGRTAPPPRNGGRDD